MNAKGIIANNLHPNSTMIEHKVDLYALALARLQSALAINWNFSLENINR